MVVVVVVGGGYFIMYKIFLEEKMHKESFQNLNLHNKQDDDDDDEFSFGFPPEPSVSPRIELLPGKYIWGVRTKIKKSKQK